MTFKDFEKNIATQILERGKSYFRNGRVISFEEADKDLWEAEVEGTEIYNVSVSTDKIKINSWDCDCPYDSGPICKHTVAVLYAIAEYIDVEKKNPGKEKKPKNLNKQRIENIFKKVTKEELEDFILEQFKTEKNLRNYFLAHFADKIEEKPDMKYKSLIQNLIKIYSGNHGFIEYRNAGKLTNSLSELAAKAGNILEDGKISESLVICKSLIEEFPDILNNIDDSGGGMTELIYETFEIFSMIVAGAPPILKEELFVYCMKEIQKEKYRGFEIDYKFLDILPELVTTEEEEKIFFNFLDSQIKIEKKKDYSEYSVVSLINTKIDFLKKNKRNSEIKKITEQNVYYSEFKKIVIAEEIKDKNYERAKELCLEGIEISESNYHHGTSKEWREKLLEIAERQNDIKGIREWTEKLFLSSGFELKYYKKLKSTYKENEWKDELEKIIKKILKDKNRYYFTETLAEIYKEEKSYDKLLELVKKNSASIRFIDQYAKYIKDIYPEELIILYVNAIIDKALITDVKVYEDVAGYMKKLSKIKGSESKIKELLNYFRMVYRSRRKMMEILDKNFPEKKQ